MLVGLGFEHRLVKAWRQHVDQVDVAGELAMFLARDAGRHENSQMPDGFMDRVDDGLPIGADFVDAVIEIENPVQAPAAAA